MKIYLCLVLFLSLSQLESCEGRTTELKKPTRLWALLTASSTEWINYRHQADVCHAYQLLRNNGIPDSNIIVMMPDDIANNTENPTPGVIINYPNGPNVYEGVLKDYTGKDVTSSNFLNVLSGNKSAMEGIGSGKVIESGPDDVVFVYFVDHGSYGILHFPGDDDLHSDELIITLNKMSYQNQFSKMILYIEACHSGSLFDNLLPEDTNIFAMTAADPRENSFACYLDAQRKTYLGDIFSVLWMNDTESEDLSKESLHNQFQLVRHLTDSHVQEYGDLDIGSTKLKEVLGEHKNLMNPKLSKQNTNAPHPTRCEGNENVPLSILEFMQDSATNWMEKMHIQHQINHLMKKRSKVDEVFKKIVQKVYTKSNDLSEGGYSSDEFGLDWEIYPCYKKLYRTFADNCLSFGSNPYARTHLHKLIYMCHVVEESEAIETILSICKKHSMHLKLVNVL